MNQENREASVLLKSIAAMQIVVMVMFAGGHLWLFLSYSAQMEMFKSYQSSVQEYKAREEEYERHMAAKFEQFSADQMRHEKDLDDYYEKTCHSEGTRTCESRKNLKRNAMNTLSK
jgi:hypothetical protein